MNLRALLFVIFSTYSAFSLAANDTFPSPVWFQRDVARKAKWLPSSIKTLGLNGAFQSRWSELPLEVQDSLGQARIPKWMIALIPTDPSVQSEISKQLVAINSLSGAAPTGALAQRAEQLLIFGGAAQLPTPGDVTTGASLGAEGCSAAMARYILSELKLEFPDVLASMPDQLATSQSSVEIKTLFLKLAKSGATWFDLKEYPFAQLKAQNILPGSLMIGQKPGGTHVFGWTRVLSFWGWSVSAKMAIGNTGLPQFGSRMILAQEYITDDPTEFSYSENSHNEHGPINSNNVILSHGQPVLSDSRTNVYAAQDSDFIVINLH